MPVYNRCMYMAHACFYVCCSDCVWVWECLFCSGHVFSPGVLKYILGLCRGCDVGFSACILRRGAVGARVWEV